MDVDWVLAIRDLCRAAEVPFFFKQWGGVNKKRTGRLLAGRSWDEVPNTSSSSSRPRRLVQAELRL